MRVKHVTVGLGRMGEWRLSFCIELKLLLLLLLTLFIRDELLLVAD